VDHNNVILLLDPRGVIGNGGYDVINRQLMYSDRLGVLTKSTPIKLLIFTALSTSNNRFSYNQLPFIHNISQPTFNSILFAYKSFRKIRRLNLRLKLLVAGDPWESYWTAYFIKKLTRRHVPIQIQVHGDIADPGWRTINYKNMIRFWLAKRSLLRASSIRCVSKKQELNLMRVFGVNKSIISVVPVPIQVPESNSFTINRPRTIGFVGRIHRDRGIHEFLELVEYLNSTDLEFKVLIAGDGPGKDKFISTLVNVLSQSRVVYLGQISQIELQSTWNSIGVLASTAPAESYGRVMREALVAGVPVWATKSSGVEDLISKAGKDVVKILDLKKSNRELSKEFDQLLKSKVLLSFRKQFIKDNSTYAQLLAKSWVDLINKQKL
jgi:glycosyltransferase involved in cell wall biosynthesis